jgi:hypothetical protein
MRWEWVDRRGSTLSEVKGRG